MSKVTVRAITSKKDIKAFIKFPYSIYRDNPYWVPPLNADIKSRIDTKKNPFYKHAERELFIAERDGVIVGRIGAVKNDLHNKHNDDNIGFFGFFECIDDQEVANALFDATKTWLKEKGFDAMRGPANPSSNDEYGLLLEGFDDSPRLMMAYTPKYYLDLCEGYGFKKEKDLFAYKLENKKVTSSEKLARVAEIARKRSRIVVRSADLKNFKPELEKIKAVYNGAWAPNWGFVPMTEEEIDNMAKEMKPLVEPKILLIGEIDDRPVGFALVLRDYNFIIKKLKGKLFPFGFLKLYTQRKKVPWARVLTLGIIPEFQKRGLDAVFYWEVVNRAYEIGIEFGEASWILEDNEMMNRGAKVMNGELYKKYRIYQINI